jgi:hypothetical protein
MDPETCRYFTHEARALLGRLERIPPFVTSQVMVPAANVSPAALRGIERHLAQGRRLLRHQLRTFLSGLHQGPLAHLGAAELQRRFTLLRLRFGTVVTQFDLFDDVMAQRSARDHGLWLAGLDALAADTLALPGRYDAPPVVCYLDRGVGAAIRRARTRLPGGQSNPVAIIRMPRERLIGSGIASSLVHEVGHQAAALLGLVDSLRQALRQQHAKPRHDDGHGIDPWRLWERWISEIVADCWSVARIGVGSTLGLMGVVSLPAPFVFRVSLDDPHPFPWIRVFLSAQIGAALYPHPQWQQLQRRWQDFYPPDTQPEGVRQILRVLQRAAPDFVDLLLSHRPPSLAGDTLQEALAVQERQPARLASLVTPEESTHRALLGQLPPGLAMAAIGQARMDNRLDPERDSRLVDHLLTHWALHRALAAPAPTRCPPFSFSFRNGVIHHG